MVSVGYYDYYSSEDCYEVITAVFDTDELATEYIEKTRAYNEKVEEAIQRMNELVKNKVSEDIKEAVGHLIESNNLVLPTIIPLFEKEIYNKYMSDRTFLKTILTCIEYDLIFNHRYIRDDLQILGNIEHNPEFKE